MSRARRSLWTHLCCGLAALLMLSCVSGYSERKQADQAVAEGRIDEAVAIREGLREQHPDSTEMQNELGQVYYQRARKALDEGRLEDYRADLARAQGAWLESLRLNPASPSPHTWLGIASAYTGNLDSALKSFNNARKLDELNPVHYTNIAEVYIYKGELAKARRWLEAGRRKGAPPVMIELNQVLAAWRAGDETEARDVFEIAYSLDPGIVRNWNEAPVAEPIASFDDLASFCCSHVACGPYMEDACHAQELAVKQREVDEETLRQELVLEMERQRSIREIYSKRKDLKIEVEDDEPAAR